MMTMLSTSHTKFWTVAMLVVAFALLLPMLFAAPAYAESSGTRPLPPISGGQTGGGSSYCRNGDLYVNNLLMYHNYPRCANNTIELLDSDGYQYEVDSGSVWDNEHQLWDCTAYFETWRFYGSESNPTQTMTRSIAPARAPCNTNEQFVFSIPHPHDAGVTNPGPPFTPYRWISTTDYPTYRTGTCNLGDDPVNLAHYFQPSSAFTDPTEADLARQVRQQFGEMYGSLVSSVIDAGLPSSFANAWMNTTGARTYAGDDFSSINFSDNLPCSSGLDATIHEGDPVTYFGVCFVPVRDTFLELTYKPTGAKTYVRRAGTYSHAYYDTAWAHQSFSSGADDAITAAYRSALNLDPSVDRPQVRSSIPCYYGHSTVFDINQVDAEPTVVVPPTLQAPDLPLVYVGGERTKVDITLPEPEVDLGPNQWIDSVTWYQPQINAPAGWTRCASTGHSSYNDATCDYALTATQVGNSQRIQMRFYTATRPDEVFSYRPRVRVVVGTTSEVTYFFDTLGGTRMYTGSGTFDFNASTVTTTRTSYQTVWPVFTTSSMRVAGQKLSTGF